jgi:hypothetical protein
VEEEEEEVEDEEKAFFENRRFRLEKEFWENEAWKEVRQLIQKTLPTGLRKRIFEQNFAEGNINNFNLT